MRCAVIQRASSLHKNATTPPISSGSPTLPNAVIALIFALYCALSRISPPAKSVAMAPGATTLTLILL